MARCNGCGGVVGRDCFNPTECEWITRNMEQQESYQSGYRQAEIDAHEKAMQEDYYATMQEPEVNQQETWEEIGKQFVGIIGTAQWNNAIELFQSKYTITRK